MVASTCGVPRLPTNVPSPRFRASRAVEFRRVLGLGFVVGSGYFAGTLYWLVDVVVVFGGLSGVIAWTVTGLLVAFLASFPALSLLGTAMAVMRWGGVGLFWAPVFWVSGELARTYLFGGFPWVLLGYTQATVLPVAQLASIGGVYSLSALVALVATCLAYAALVPGRPRILALSGGLAVVLVVTGWGWARLEASSRLGMGDPVVVALVQGNVAQEDKWDPRMRGEILTRYLEMSRAATARGATLVVWPESSTPFYFEEDRAGAEAIRELARTTGAHLLIGSDQVERSPEYRLYNAAFHVRPDGEAGEVYRKIHLVPFGEYVPFQQLLPFVNPLVDSVSHFSPGTGPQTFRIGNRLATTAICYEVVYPALIGQSVEAGSQLLTTITNDAWYGHSSAPVQHFEQAAVRAIEQGRYLIRAANTGISGVVDPYGRIVRRSGLFVPETIVETVRFIDVPTVYGRVGDLFAYLCVLSSVVAILATARDEETP